MKLENVLHDAKIYFAGILAVLSIQQAAGQTVTGRVENVPDRKPVLSEIRLIDKVSGHTDKTISDTLYNGYFSLNTTNGNKILEVITNNHDIIRDSNIVISGNKDLGTIQPYRENNADGTNLLDSTDPSLHGSSLLFSKVLHLQQDSDFYHDVLNWPSNRRRLYITGTNDSTLLANIDSVLKRITDNRNNIVYDKQATDSTVGISMIGVPGDSAVLHFGKVFAKIDQINTVSTNPLKRHIKHGVIYFANDQGPLDTHMFSYALLTNEHTYQFSPDSSHVMAGGSSTAPIASKDEVNMVNNYQMLQTGTNLETYIDSVGAVDSTLTLPPISVSFIPGWNMFSIPTKEPNMARMALIPEAISNAFGYDGGYNQADTLENVMGYWIKLNAPENKQFSGEKILSDTLHLRKGWNIIGASSYSVPLDGVEDPSGIIESQLFKYDGSGYQVEDTLKPGEAYWLKAKQDGDLIMKIPGL